MTTPEKPHEITVYSKPACVQCTAVTRALDAAGVPYNYVDLTQDAAAMDHVQELGYRQAPVVQGFGRHFSGFNPSEVGILKSSYQAELANKSPEPEALPEAEISLSVDDDPDMAM